MKNELILGRASTTCEEQITQGARINVTSFIVSKN
jgi:primosomal replication protein N